MSKKICSKCKRELPSNSDYFFKRKGSKDGLQGVCKECATGSPFTDKLKFKTEDGYRICYKCSKKYELNSDNFYKSKLSRGGFNTICKNCDKKSNKAYKDKNKEKSKEQWSNWYANNKDRISEYNKQYRKENIDGLNEYNREYQKMYRQTDNGKAIRRMHWHSREAKLRNLEYSFTESEWDECKEYFNYQCAYCGCTPEILTQDHFVALNNGGAYIKNNIIPCCFSCNSSKQDSIFYEWYESKDFYNIQNVTKIEKYLGIEMQEEKVVV